MAQYVLVAEFKDDGALVYETYLKNTSYEEARNRMKQLKQDPNVTKVAIALLVHCDGHPELITEKLGSRPMPF